MERKTEDEQTTRRGNEIDIKSVGLSAGKRSVVEKENTEDEQTMQRGNDVDNPFAGFAGALLGKSSAIEAGDRSVGP